MIDLPDIVPTLLMTDFEPFDGDDSNPSWEVAREFEKIGMNGIKIIAVRLPCVFSESLRCLFEAIELFKPNIVLSLGLAGNRADYSIEKVAINLMDAIIPDNAGDQPLDLPVVDGAPAAYFSRLPIKTILAVSKAYGGKISVSFSAGTFVCNQVFFGLLHYLSEREDILAGFIHVPPLPQQVRRYRTENTMSLEDQIANLKLIIFILISKKNGNLSTDWNVILKLQWFCFGLRVV